MSISYAEPGAGRALAYQMNSKQKHGLVLTDTNWGYIITQANSGKATKLLATLLGRFIGGLLLTAAAVLWLAPDSMVGADVLSIKLAATLLFTIIGAYLIWVGRAGLQPEVQVDLIKREVRRGHRSLRGGFVQVTRLGFDDVGSIFIQRSHEAGRVSRLFLRVGQGDEALEITRGAMLPLERLRDRLAHDLTPHQVVHHPRPTKLPPFGQYYTI